MNNTESSLRSLGLTDEEIKIYLALLQYGTQSVAGIARLSKLGRGNCYHYIDKLREKGLISQSQQQKVKHFSAENPKVFINREVEKLNLAREVVPTLLAMTSKHPQRPKIEFFEGKEGIKSIFTRMVQHRHTEIVSFSNFERLARFLPDFLPEHFEQRLQQNIKTRFISPRNPVAEQFRDQFFPAKFDERLLETFLIAEETFFFESDISIFGGSIAIMNLSAKEPVGVLIENPELYHTQKAIFDLAWLGATSFITG
jgi:sugar-specific transcriptional regulator TrmB